MRIGEAATRVSLSAPGALDGSSMARDTFDLLAAVRKSFLSVRALDCFMQKTTYTLGHSPGEAGRIIRQAEVLRPITQRLLRNAGVDRGMHVLDIGCGPGDVTLLAADLVGPTGRVTGIDPSSDAIALARSRADAGAYRNTEFVCSSLEKLTKSAKFDAVVCRYVLIHQSDPVGFIESASQFVRNGGVLALHEMDISRGLYSSPRLVQLHQAEQWAMSALKHAGAAVDAGGRLVQIFADAGLPTPQFFSETIVERADNGLVCGWITDIVRSLLPELTRAGLVPADLDIDEFEKQILAAAARSPSQVEFVPQMCAWVWL
jgi:ubiquinone/menaquinone biosynthesis C-methylase UbiE